jgi:hypothetical protein
VSSQFIVAQLNARLQPMHRGDYFEDPLDEALQNAKCGEVSGGGTLQSKTGEIEYCDIEIQIDGDPSIAERVAIEALVRLGAPKGSKLILEDSGREVPFGNAEGMAVYLNGSELPDEVYTNCDSNFVYSEFERLLDGTGRVLSYWQGPTETAFYMYGQSFQEMRRLLAEFMATYPLCAKARVEQIA